MIVKDAAVFHDWDHYGVEEIPHALACTLLIVDQFAETSEPLVSRLRAEVVESGQDWRFKDRLELRIHLWVLSADSSQNSSNGSHQALSCQTSLLVEV